MNTPPSVTESTTPSDARRWRDLWKRRTGLGVAILVLAGLALVAPLLRAEVYGRVGLLLIIAALVQVAHGFRRATPASQWEAWVDGGVTLGMGLLLINAPNLATSALLLFLGGSFGFDGLRYLASAARRRGRRRSDLAWGVGYLTAGVLLLVFRRWSPAWTVSVAAALRLAGTASSIIFAPVLTARESGAAVLSHLGLDDHPELEALALRVADEEAARSTIDRGWIIGYVATLFAIHLGRMGLDRSALGILSPVVAVLGDLLFALILAFVMVIPASSTWRRLTRRPERWAWSWWLTVPAEAQGWARRLTGVALSYRLRSSIRLQQARYSFRTALSRGLQIGLPLAAVIAATVPVWGMSWFFDTENYATGIWNNWAEERTDTWREAMVRTLWDEESKKNPVEAFSVHPPDIDPGGDFSFLVIGDTGEGDASQHSLRAEYLEVVRRDRLKFVVVSSDVVYPTGAMKDYEAHFWLPFMGTTKPVYAIPGNHDWYDALEGFAATFLTPSAARSAMRARVAVDGGLTSTTDAHIEKLIETASHYQREYRVPTQHQQAPFFQFQTDTFALFAVDTGVARTVDPLQLAWLDAALTAAKGKTKLAILGHPLYAAGSYQASESKEFAALHQLLRRHGVAIVMAGDTHDLEYYLEKGDASHGQTLHFVNGGGGAYLSFGTALDWPDEPATADWAYYPNKAQILAKIRATTPPWKRPAWWWTERCGAWPFSPEWLSGAFDVNVAPFMQSFMEIHVEPSKNRIRLVPHGIHGPLRWSDFDASPTAKPADGAKDDFVEWTVPMNQKK